MTRRVMLITAPLSAHGLERLQGLSSTLSVMQWQHRSMGSVPDDVWSEVEILYTSFATPLPLPEQVPHLRWVQLYSAGPDYILDQPLFATPTIFTTTSGIHATPIAEYVFAMVLAWFRHLPRIFEWQQRAAWPTSSERIPLFAGEELRDKTFGIIGYGSVGREVARLATAFGMRVLAMQRGTNRQDTGLSLPDIGDPAGALPDRFYSPDELHAMLGVCDIVVIAVPLTARTRGMFDDAAFQAIRPTALLVNIARGAICDEIALMHALQEKQLAGAILDVFHEEPLPPEHPLWYLPNVFISPHCSGLTPLYEERAARICEENVRRYLAVQPLCNVVDKAQEY